ncbi:ORF_5 [Catopsilia pomona nucleopolyhedrovirus]|uniref:ORF_5 n=1 Tax=Catopsilia pomona nucleopolyhedrovirus TaxID=1850906 RepID=A0A172WZK6_9ABAC|nr:ORF_5 [Catopsilia pomona nucleopolyhedrovirus]ANF29779.1 ORF_5 [Catopsilia pomona nucleopolyhedrovirus]
MFNRPFTAQFRAYSMRQFPMMKTTVIMMIINYNCNFIICTYMYNVVLFCKIKYFDLIYNFYWFNLRLFIMDNNDDDNDNRCIQLNVKYDHLLHKQFDDNVEVHKQIINSVTTANKTAIKNDSVYNVDNNVKYSIENCIINSTRLYTVSTENENDNINNYNSCIIKI